MTLVRFESIHGGSVYVNPAQVTLVLSEENLSGECVTKIYTSDSCCAQVCEGVAKAAKMLEDCPR